ncbi:MAG: hypothetical protein ACPG4U_08110 [Pseudomonadales bacterium]
MKAIYITALAALLGGCSSFTPYDRDTPLAVRAFADICLASAPSFDAAQQNARAYKLEAFRDFGASRSAMTADQRLGVQVKPGKECVITTAKQRDNTLTAAFIETVTRATGSESVAKTPFVATLGAANYIFLHDRKGGEAFVMLQKR